MTATGDKRQATRKTKRVPLFPTQKEMQLGKWSLTPNHDLKLSLREEKNQPFLESVTLKGRIVSVDANELAFAAHGVTEESHTETRLIRLEGSWRADDWNRLSFQLKKGDPEAPLVFQGVWEVDEHYQLLYRYQKKDPVTGEKKEELLSFRGVWEIRKKDYLTYALDINGKSRFDFQAAVQSPSLLGKTGEIRYQVGIRLSGRRTLLRDVVLFGKWKVSKEFSLSFEMEYEEGRRHAISFDTHYRVGE